MSPADTPRPEPPDLNPETARTHRWEPCRADGEGERWTLQRPDNSTRPAGIYCRMKVTDRRNCIRLAVAWLARQQSRRHGGDLTVWWGYCGEHLYGRWIEGGQLYEWRLREISAEEATR